MKDFATVAPGLGIARLSLSGKASGIFMRAFAEVCSEACGQTHAGLAELVSQAVRGGHGVSPALLVIAVEEVDLIRLIGKRRCVHAEQSDLRTFLPILPKECADLLEDFCVELGGGSQGVSSGDSREILVA